MTQVDELFDIWTGHGIDLIRLERVPPTHPEAVAYVSRSEKNNGVTAYVRCPPAVAPAEAGTLSVAVGGSICSTFVQPRRYICAQNVRVLTPRKAMSLREKLWWARCIRENRYRFNYGRHANRTLAHLDLPDAPAPWLDTISGTTARKLAQGMNNALNELNGQPQARRTRKARFVDDLFEVSYGHSLTLNALEKDSEGIPFVSRKRGNNGIAARVARLPSIKPAPEGALTVALGGSVLATFVQHEPFYTAFHVAVLTPRYEMTLREKLWWALCIEANDYRYNYGRQANRTLSRLELPRNVPRWVVNTNLDFADSMAAQLRTDLGALGFAA